MKIAITGASGFLGKYVLRLLIKNGLDVVAVTRSRVSLLEFEACCRIVEFDILKSVSAPCYKMLGEPDVLLHLAWEDISNYMHLSHFETQVSMHYRFIKSLVEAGLGSVCVSGSCFEYGGLVGQVKEDMIGNPPTAYGYAKNALRQQLKLLQSEKAIDFRLTWMRLFYLFGDGQPGNTIFSQIQTAVENKILTFDMSGGEQLLDYMQVEEAAELIFKLTVLNENIDTVNLCSGKPISLRSLVEGWIEEYKWNIKLNLGSYPYRKVETMALWGDRTYLNEVLKLGKR
jgi:nucleoside-diphosphate-sugar epimerase